MKEIDALINYPIRKVLEFYNLGGNSDKDKEQILCPFHGDTAPSLLINNDKNFAYCFGCNKGWDSVEFIRQKEKVGFFTALRKLSEIAGLNYDEATLRYIYYQHPTAFAEKESIREEKRFDDMALNIFSEFLLYCHQWPEFFGNFYHYIDWCVQRWDVLVEEPIDKNRLDKVKDWLFISKKFIDKKVPLVMAYRKFKREEQSERTNENLGVEEY